MFLSLPFRVVCVICVFCIQNAFAQQLEKEVKQDVSRKAARGKLNEIVNHADTKQIELSFVTKSTNKKIKYESYFFDYDLNFIKEENSEDELVKVKRGKLKRYKGDSYSVIGLEAKADMFGNAVFKRKEITYGWNWMKMGYSKNVRTLDKIKPKTDDGSKMWFFDAYEMDTKGEVLALVGEKDKKDAAARLKNFSVLHVNKELDILHKIELPFEYLQYPIYFGSVQSDESHDAEDVLTDYVIVFAPAEGAGMNKSKGGAANNYTLVRINPDGVLVDRIAFNSKGNDWKIEGIYQIGESLVAYGPCKAKDITESYFDAYKDPAKMAEMDKFTHFQMVGLKSKSVGFVSLSSIEDFEKKTKTPSNQKGLSSYNGKRVEIAEMRTAPNGDMFVLAQDYKLELRDKERLYEDAYIFHFSPGGELKASYSIDPESKKGGLTGGGLTDARHYHCTLGLVSNSNGDVVLLLKSPRVIQSESNTSTFLSTVTTTSYYWPRYQIRAARINMANASISDVKIFGNDDYYLFDEYGDSEIVIREGGTENGTAKLIVVCEGRKEKKIWLGKLNPDKF
ncbi:hypothetical protein [Xanthocytophaga agilis]|uniref:Uncharacterized protein n=1 Tax=Xanthocytophaga agilis TaxID=3048010 RepID=A0AAE3UBC8_9BACT|nr:hypothetical protein [Xanthocytophaga agilis]MDJ1499678.1 hypothetical protein [Xanthocytophaga agilis]